MNKKLLSIAVAAALAAPMAAVSADVTIYGKMHYSWDYADTNDAANDDSDDQTGISRASRLGFKGSEDLGGGLKAVWQIETQINTTLGSRNTFVGLSGDWGTVLAGNHDTPYKIATGKLDIMGDTIADYGNILSRGNQNQQYYDNRTTVVAYVSPNMSGFTAALARASFKVNEGAGADETEAWSVAGMYNNGPLFASLAWESHETVNDATATQDADSWKAGVQYKFGAGTVGAVYESTDSPSGSGIDGDRFIINGSYKFGNNTIKVIYGDSDESASGADDESDFYAVGLFHAFSKRTSAYVIYASVDNDTNASRSLNGIPGQTAGNDVDALSLGLVHKF